MTFPLAVCVLIMRMDGQVLSVSRRKDTNNWGLPGGKVDPGETPLEAAIRETKEETGLELNPVKMSELYRAVCPGDVTYDVVTYFYDAPGPAIEDLVPEENLNLAYFDFDVLMDPSTSPFADYNRGVLRALASRIVAQMS